MVSLILLFGNFYVNEYIRKTNQRKAKIAAQNGKKIKNSNGSHPVENKKSN